MEHIQRLPPSDPDHADLSGHHAIKDQIRVPMPEMACRAGAGHVWNLFPSLSISRGPSRNLQDGRFAVDIFSSWCAPPFCFLRPGEVLVTLRRLMYCRMWYWEKANIPSNEHQWIRMNETVAA
jgi:hypothetical protein